MKPLLAATLVIRSPRCYGHFFCPPGKNRHTFSCQKKKRKYGHPLVRPNFFGPIGDRINGIYCMFLGKNQQITRHWCLSQIQVLIWPSTPEQLSSCIGEYSRRRIRTCHSKAQSYWRCRLSSIMQVRRIVTWLPEVLYLFPNRGQLFGNGPAEAGWEMRHWQIHNSKGIFWITPNG